MGCEQTTQTDTILTMSRFWCRLTCLVFLPGSYVMDANCAGYSLLIDENYAANDAILAWRCQDLSWRLYGCYRTNLWCARSTEGCCGCHVVAWWLTNVFDFQIVESVSWRLRGVIESESLQTSSCRSSHDMRMRWPFGHVCFVLFREWKRHTQISKANTHQSVNTLDAFASKSRSSMALIP